MTNFDGREPYPHNKFSETQRNNYLSNSHYYYGIVSHSERKTNLICYSGHTVNT